MKNFKSLVAAVALCAGFASSANAYEKFGKTLNLGVGLGYYGYVGHTVPVIHADFELDVARNFTLAPFISFYSYRNYDYWGNPHYPYQNYYYHETVVPVGLKATYYFDQLLGANPHWDFYLAGSVGFAIRTTTWDDGYYGDKTVSHGASPLFLDLHIGSEYHISKKVGLFLDLSTGVSTFGLGIHI